MASVLHAVPHAVTEIDEKTDSHPHREAYPRVSAQLNHEINVDKDADDGQKRQKRNHEGHFLAGLRLSADHEHTAAEDEEADGQQGEDPHFQVQDGADVVRGEITHHTHHQH